ncbi:hypothetical protein N7527_000554 [Penicillium freii]|nr:hypothetical protein N7527_000554 [Penicillium freii]
MVSLGANTEAFPTRVFVLVGFNEASISRQLKAISWTYGRLGTAVWKWKESVGGIELVEHEEEDRMAARDSYLDMERIC